MADKTKLKEFLVKISKLSESLANVKETIEGDRLMAEDKDLEAKALLEAEAAKKKAEEKGEKEDKKESKKEEDDEESAEAKAKKNEDTTDSELTKNKKAYAELTQKLEEAEAKIQLLSQEVEKATAAALATKEQEIKDAVNKTVASYLENPLEEEVFASLVDLDEVEKAIASKYGFKGLVKFASELSKEAASWKEEKVKAEASKLADTRYSDLETTGVAFIGEKASAQKEKISKMTEEAFASYKEDLQSIQSSISLNSDEVLKKARESAGAKSKAVDLETKNKFDDFKKFI